MDEHQKSLILSSSSCFPPPQGVKLSYGTAGFRADASILQSTVFRIGILAALRSLKTQSVIGLMITASHNQVSDNGIKIADPSGGMLTQEWEPFADSIANAPTPEELLQLVEGFVKNEGIRFDGSRHVEMLLGRDTRPSGESLLEAAKQGICSIVGANVVDMGIVTTPQLHWMVRAKNKGLKATELDYFEQLSASFRCLLDLIPSENNVKKADNKLVVDGANGVGGEKLEGLAKSLDGLNIEIRNSGKGVLNEGVGADYVQKEKILPLEFDSKDVGTRLVVFWSLKSLSDKNSLSFHRSCDRNRLFRCASLDGDADRLVYFSVPSANSNKVELVDGDKILSLFAVFIKKQLSTLNESEDSYQARLGVIQTAYANGASTNYLRQLGLEVVFTPTGVKYLHEKAAHYDVGIYFEANGHGTILFSDNFLSWLEAKNNELASKSKGSEEHKAALRLLAVSNLINQAVGDALSGLLLVEAILLHMGWSIRNWNELYQDLPSRQLKVKVADRTAVKTANAETVAVQPPGIQEAINSETAKYPNGRCFIRPSGTEDVIRVYAEASTQEAADSLAKSVDGIVDRFLGSGSN
ncbi:Phosphoacetylglucosamine mutase [Linum grandiflorum]